MARVLSTLPYLHKPLLLPATLVSQLLDPVFKMVRRDLGGLEANTCPQSSLCILKTFSRVFLIDITAGEKGTPKSREGKYGLPCPAETLEALDLLSHPQCLL